MSLSPGQVWYLFGRSRSSGIPVTTPVAQEYESSVDPAYASSSDSDSDELHSSDSDSGFED